MSEPNPSVPIADEMPAPQAPSPVVLVLRREDRGAVIAREPVTHQDLGDALAELWREACLRRGFVDVALGALRASLRPVYPDTTEVGEAGRRCLGFDLEARDPEGRLAKCFFSVYSLSGVAARAARKLVQAGALGAQDTYYYELAANEAPALGAREAGAEECAEAGPGVDEHPIAAAASGPPPETLPVPLKPLLERARSAGDASDLDHFPVFYTPAARENAERVAREGGASNPPVETGGLLVGPLCSCPETGELFAVIVDVLEAANTERTTYSLTYSGQTWARIRAVMRAKQSHPSTRGHRILGQVHGHSFPPLGGHEPCASCQLLEVCTRTSAYLSSDDRDWCRAVFHRQPWQLSHVFGLNARCEPVEAFYGQWSGWLVKRGYALLDAPFEAPPIRGVTA